jgi:ABC-type antimicrobial peptide transport system permease subunit
MKSKNSPPPIAKWLFSRFIPKDEREYFMASLIDVYVNMVSLKGKWYGWSWFWLQLLKSLPSFFLFFISGGIGMVKNYIKIALRNIARYKGFSFINITGLALGMACCILILLWVQDELNYETIHKQGKDIFRVAHVNHSTGKAVHAWRTPPPLSPALAKTFPEVVGSTRFHQRNGTLVKFKNKQMNEKAGFIDLSAFNMFSFTFVKGSPETVFRNPNSAVISDSMAKKYFGSQNPLGKRITIDNQFDLNITGVVKTMGHNTLLQFDFLTQFETIKYFIGKANFQHWGYCGFHTFLLLKTGTNLKSFNKKIAPFLRKNYPKSKMSLYLQPLHEIHLHSLGGGGPIILVTIFSLVAFAILLIACINFMNLSTARSSKRAKEIGLRKAIGAKRIQIIIQFFGESFILVLASLLMALLLVELSLPAFRDFTGKPMTLLENFSSNSKLLLGLAAIALTTSLISCSYPALYFSAIRPVKVLKGLVKFRSSPLRKGLVVFQYALATFLIITTSIVYNQLHYMKDKNPGFNRDNLVNIRMNQQLSQKYQLFRDEILKIQDVIDVTSTSVLLGTGTNLSGIEAHWPAMEPDKKVNFHVISVNFSFIKTFNMKMAQGRCFSEEFPADNERIIINESAVRQMGIESPVGKKLTVFGHTGEIIGVVKDFNFESLHKKVAPMILLFLDDWNSQIVVRVKTNSTRVISQLDKIARKIAPEFPFEYVFLDDQFNRLYKSEQHLGAILGVFSILAIVIASLGLFGLSSFTAQQRFKEMGIRKTFGANWTAIMIIMSKEFSRWVVLANLLAWPSAYLAMTLWLKNFSFRITLGWEMFFLPSLLVLGIALITVSHQSIKTALVNPVEIFRHE